jgi:hypothetical protein
MGDTARDKDYFEEIISSGFGKYIQREYIKAIKKLGATPHQHINYVMWERVGKREFLKICLSDAPLVSVLNFTPYFTIIQMF